MTKEAFIRTELLEEQAPPTSSIGVIGWLRANLFSSWVNTALTLLSLWLVFSFLSGILPWAFSSVWKTSSFVECREVSFVLWQNTHAHACWSVINERWVQMLFGFYPSHLYWRPILALILLGFALAPILFDAQVSRKLWLVSAAYPFVMPWLIWGGPVLTPILVFMGFVVGYLVYRAMLRLFNVTFLLAVSVTIIAVLGWWYLSLGLVSDSFERVVAGIKMETRLAHETQQIEPKTLELEALELEQREFKKEIHDAVAVKDAAFSTFKQNIEKGVLPSEPQMRALRDDFLQKMAVVYDKKTAALAIGKQTGQLKNEIGRAKFLVKRIEGLEEIKAKIVAQKDEISAAKSALRQASGAEEKERLRVELAKAKKDYTTLKTQVDFVYGAVAGFGLEKVISRDFGGFMLSILIGIVAIGCSLPIGIFLALGRQSDLLFIKYICVGFIEFFRGVPLITLLLIASTLLNIFLPPGTKFDIISRVMIMVTIFSSAYVAEVIRGGLAALPKGQYEGADSLGLSYWQAQYLIIMPQALKVSIPGIVSTFIGVFKDTTLVLIIGLLDPLGLAKATRADTAWTGIYWELYVFIAIPFFAICFSMSRYSMYLERKLKTDNH